MTEAGGKSDSMVETGFHNPSSSADHEEVMSDHRESMLRSRGQFITKSSKSETDHTNTDINSNLVESILGHLYRDILACDVQLSLFIGAARSYRHDSSVSPFPPLYLDSAGNKDIKGIHEAISYFPSLPVLKESLEKGTCALSDKQLNLLQWIFAGGSSKLTLRSLKECDYYETLKSLGVQMKPTHVMPNLLLQVSKSNTDSWNVECEEANTFYGFHGSRLDNWYSILHNGLQQHRSKTSKFGEGIYLSSDFTLSLNYSTSGVTWEKSLMGPSLSCLSINQIINHENVKIHSSCPVRGKVDGSEGGNIPENHILVRDNQLLHARYLMVYCGNGLKPGENCESIKRSGSLTAGSANVQRNRLLDWASQNKMLVVLLCYALLLAVVSLSSSPWLRRMLTRYGTFF